MRKLAIAILALALSACAISGPPRNGAAECVLGVDPTLVDQRAGMWGDSVDGLITFAIDQGHDTWLC